MQLCVCDAAVEHSRIDESERGFVLIRRHSDCSDICEGRRALLNRCIEWKRGINNPHFALRILFCPRPLELGGNEMQFPEGHLIGEAKSFADGLKHRRIALEGELAEVERRRSEIMAQLDAAVAADARYDTFKPTIGGENQCPRCWMYDGERASVRPIRGTSDEDVFRCNRCERTYSYPFR
jgi:hypothetical protein